jgi:hypothetical protein
MPCIHSVAGVFSGYHLKETVSAHILDNFLGKVLEIASAPVAQSESVGLRTRIFQVQFLPGAPSYLSFKISITKVKSHVDKQ